MLYVGIGCRRNRLLAGMALSECLNASVDFLQWNLIQVAGLLSRVMGLLRRVAGFFIRVMGFEASDGIVE